MTTSPFSLPASVRPLLRASAFVIVSFVVLAAHAGAQDHAHPAPGAEQLGAVHFPTSCAAPVARDFDRAVALLHSFEFAAAIRGFEGVLAADPNCAMAWWGIALSRWSNPMVSNIRPPAALARGRQAADEAVRLAAGATARERGYSAAVAQLYAGFETRDQRTRLLAYEQAMGALAAANPGDTEARIFHAISLVGSALPSDKTYANQIRAGTMLEAMWAEQPDHPGLAHYIIHSYDVPALADRAAAAARRYATIAPSASHALHMPSHTFTRVGLWRESAQTNARSFDAAVRDGAMAEALHAADYMIYAYLQTRQDSAARAIVDQLPSIDARFDPAAVTGAAPGSAGLFALAAIPARFALERRAWHEAATLKPRPTAFAYTEAVTWFARALGAAHEGDVPATRVAVDSLTAFRARLLAAGEAVWAEQVEIQRLGASAWLAFASGQRDEAVRLMRDAATAEDRTEKPAVTPGPLAPAREMLGDMLLEIGQPAEALAAYRATLTREPNRNHTLDGAMRAARATGDSAAAAGYARAIEALRRP